MSALDVLSLVGVAVCWAAVLLIVLDGLRVLRGRMSWLGHNRPRGGAQ